MYKTAPYLHDGSASTLEEVLTITNFDDSHGVTSQLSATERQELVAFLLTLSSDQESSDQQSIAAECVLPTVAASTTPDVALTLNQSSFMSGDQLSLTMEIAGEGIVDLYAAIVLPDNSYLTIGPAENFSATNEAIAYRGSFSVGAMENFSLLELLLPEGVAVGTYSVIAIATPPGANVLDASTWIASHTLTFEVF